MAQFTKQGVYLNTVNGELSEFKLDSQKLLQENFTEEEIQHTLHLVQKSKVLPMHVT